MSESIEEWSLGGPNRFYFTEAYNPKEKTFDEPPYDIINTSKSGKGKGKGKSIAKKVKRTEKKQVIETPVDYPTIPRKLRMLDMFAGCGGTLYYILFSLFASTFHFLHISLYMYLNHIIITFI